MAAGAMRQQLRYLLADAERIVAGKRSRWLVLPFTQSFLAMAWYRLERGCWLTWGRRWEVARLGLVPLRTLLRPWIGLEINHKADIGPGFLVLHPSLGLVISEFATIGRRVTVVGGNCIGSQASGREAGAVEIGDLVQIYANASIIGPVRVGERSYVAAGAVVVSDVEPRSRVGGVPARPLERGSGAYATGADGAVAPTT